MVACKIKCGLIFILQFFLYALIICYAVYAVLEITVGHWPFSNQFHHLADQNLF